MMKGTLFCLEECTKCNSVKEELDTDPDIEIITLEKEGPEVWDHNDYQQVQKLGILPDLERTAPILVLNDGTKYIGQLQILRWLKNNKQ